MNKKIIIVNGPNLNMLGNRQNDVYGSISLAEIKEKAIMHTAKYNAEVDFVQSNHEGEIVEVIQQVASKLISKQDNIAGLIINPAAYSHSSIAIMDSLLLIKGKVPIYEVHLSNIYQREEFRHKSFVSLVADGVVSGFGYLGYLSAIDAIFLPRGPL